MKAVPSINQKKCTLCGRCVEICPKDVIEINGSEIYTNVDECMLCSHCYTVCPENAVTFDDNILHSPSFKSFKYKEKKSETTPLDLVNLFRSRRSIRKYTEKPVQGDIIDDLIEFAVTAPSGSNCQLWEFSVVNGRDKVWDLALDIKKFFLNLNRMAENAPLRYITAPFTGGALSKYYNNHMESVKTAIEASERGIDLLFHSAPCVIIIHDNGEGSTPIEDAQFAGYNISMMAHTLKLGTCFIGYAVEALNRMGDVKQKYMIPRKNRVRAVLTLGYPDIKFFRQSLRKNYLKRVGE